MTKAKKIILDLIENGEIESDSQTKPVKEKKVPKEKKVKPVKEVEPEKTQKPSALKKEEIEFKPYHVSFGKKYINQPYAEAQKDDKYNKFLASSKMRTKSIDHYLDWLEQNKKE